MAAFQPDGIDQLQAARTILIIQKATNLSMERRGGRNQRRRAPPASRPRGLTLIVGLVENFNFLDDHNILSLVCTDSTSSLCMNSIHTTMPTHSAP